MLVRANHIGGTLSQADVERRHHQLSNLPLAATSPATRLPPGFTAPVATTAPGATATALRARLSASPGGWYREMHSVESEYARLHKELAAVARAGLELGATGHASHPAEDLRALAQALLERAQQIDGLRPYAVTHLHRHGKTIYTAWSQSAPTKAQLADMLGEQFQPYRCETLESQALQLADLTGSAQASRLMLDTGGDGLGEDENAGNRPTGM